MPADAATLFEGFFRELERRDIPAVVIHGYENMPEQMPSDIDFAVRCQDLPKLLRIQREIAARQGWVLASVVHAKLFALYTVFFDAQDPSRFIQLDACGHYVERGCFVLRDEEFLQARRRNRGFSIPPPATEFGYLLAKALIKSKPIGPALTRLRTLHEADPAGTSAMFSRLVGAASGRLSEWFRRPAEEWNRDLRPRVRRRTRLGPVNLMREAGRAFRRILRPAGMQLVIFGPDGAGKSTLISRLGTLSCFRRQRQFHFRPHLFDKKSGPVVTRPHAQSPRPVFSSLAKTLYYFADHWLGYWLNVFPARVRNELVIFDRSFADQWIDPRRYRLAGVEAWARFLKRLLPKPDFTVVLDAEPEVIHARKPELAIEELRRQREALRNLAAATAHCAVIPAAESPERVEQLVRQKLIAFLAGREQRRHPD